jgi:hypothetical protein
MAVDTAQKRMSAMNLMCPWRGPMVSAADVGFTAGNREAALFSYAGIGASIADNVPLVYDIELFFTRTASITLRLA